MVSGHYSLYTEPRGEAVWTELEQKTDLETRASVAPARPCASIVCVRKGGRRSCLSGRVGVRADTELDGLDWLFPQDK